MKNKVLPEIYSSRRGDYRLTDLPNPVKWKPGPLHLTKRLQGVIDEIEAAANFKLDEHPWWKDEPMEFVNEYTSLYNELFSLRWLKNASDRHNIAFNINCCLTSVQYNNGTLHAYSRSTDMKNGYFSDKLVLEWLARTINEKRPDCHVHTISWYIAIPHEYVEPGIARLK